MSDSLFGTLSRRGFVAAGLAGAMAPLAVKAAPAPEANAGWNGISYRTVEVQGMTIRVNPTLAGMGTRSVPVALSDGIDAAPFLYTFTLSKPTPRPAAPTRSPRR